MFFNFNVNVALSMCTSRGNTTDLVQLFDKVTSSMCTSTGNTTDVVQLFDKVTSSMCTSTGNTTDVVQLFDKVTSSMCTSQKSATDELQLYLLSSRNVLQHFFNKVFCTPVNVRNVACMMLLCYRKDFWITIHSAWTGKHQLITTVSFHHLQDK